MSKFMNKRFSSLDAYTPGEQPRDMEYIKLNTNESPYPPSEAVLDAVNEGEAELLRLYPDPDCQKLKLALAANFGKKKENIFVSNGSDDILNFAFMAFGGEGVVFPEISYGFYEVFSKLHNIEYTKIPLMDDFTINPDDYKKRDCMVVIANPNAPTGIELDISYIEDIIKSNPRNVVLVDEAYVDFGGTSAISLTEKYDNLLVVQTFSKSRSLAGARIGFAIGNSEIIKDLEKIKYSTNPYSINRLSLLAGEMAVKSQSYYDKNCRLIVESRAYTTDELRKRGFEVLSSKANFVFAKKDGIKGDKIYNMLKENGILVRHFTSEKIKDYNRITIGTMEQMQKFIEVIDKILKEV